MMKIYVVALVVVYSGSQGITLMMIRAFIAYDNMQ